MSDVRQPGHSVPVKAKAILVDPDTMTAIWLNEAAAHDAGEERDWVGTPITEAVPLAEILGLGDALRAAADTGESQHVRRSLVATARGGLAVVASVYRLPTRQLLVLIDEDYELAAKRGGDDASSPRSRGRRPRG